jgi:hypothetical protein
MDIGRGHGRASPIEMDFSGTQNDDQEPRQFADARFEPKASMGPDTALVDIDHSAAINHRPSCLWQSLAATRRPPLDL